LFFWQKNLQTQSHQETIKNTKEDHHNYYLTLWVLCSLRVLVLSKLFCSLLRYNITDQIFVFLAKNLKKIGTQRSQSNTEFTEVLI